MKKTATQVALQMALYAPDNQQGELLRQVMGIGINPHHQIRLLHQLMETPAPEEPVLLSVTDRHQRLHYIMSEFLELVAASGFKLEVCAGIKARTSEPFNIKLDKRNLLLTHREGSQQDVIEMVDGLEDIMVVALGMLAEMGQLATHPAAFREVVAGSVTKLNPDTGVIDKNDGVMVPDEPIGKWIKGRDYTPPNLAAIIKLPEGYES